MPLADDIKSLALESGFHAVGITGVQPFAEAESAIQERLDLGLLDNSGFNPNKAHIYTHPQSSFPTARSIISVALSYLTDDMKVDEPVAVPRGQMARFSRGQDYHHALHDRLKCFSKSIHTKFGQHINISSCADTGPIVDRSVAIRAGLGSRGKNTCIYVREYGSWVVLGELLLDMELDPDSPAPFDICGGCTECMKACPTGAICAPYTIDVKRCLSKVTQSPGFIPVHLREKMGTRIYGCDTCQSACSRNKTARPGNVESLRTLLGLGSNPELIPLLNMTQAEFNLRVGPTTASWIRRTRFRRNVAVALGNIGDPAAVPALIEALDDVEPIIRAHAAWALGQLSVVQARSSLEKALLVERDACVLEEIREALSS